MMEEIGVLFILSLLLSLWLKSTSLFKKQLEGLLRKKSCDQEPISLSEKNKEAL